MRFCACGSIAVDGGLAYERLYGAALEDASYEPLYEYADGSGSAHRQTQFIVFLNGRLGWSNGDGRALPRLVGALRAGRLPPVDLLTVGGKRRLGYLSEVVLEDLTPAAAARTVLSDLAVHLRQAVEAFDDDGEPHWLPGTMAGVDESAWRWGLAFGLDAAFRRSLADLAP